MMNYELGMHCTGFEFAYCCVLPAYNSIVAQIARRDNGSDWPHLLEGDPNLGSEGKELDRRVQSGQPLGGDDRAAGLECDRFEAEGLVERGQLEVGWQQHAVNYVDYTVGAGQVAFGDGG